MTKEYALHLLNQLMIGASIDAKPIISQYELAQALDLAIKALESKPMEKSDAVSREGVIKTIKEMSNANPSYTHTCDVVDRQDLIDSIDELPSVTPERPKGKWIYDGDCIICNKCLKAFGWISMNMASNFCPDCGSYNGGGEADD